jgi:hypothetical protein
VHCGPQPTEWIELDKNYMVGVSNGSEITEFAGVIKSTDNEFASIISKKRFELISPMY